MSRIIFDFVRSLTFREKAYFRRFSRLHSDTKEKNYIKIFDYLEKQEIYDEQALQAHFAEERFVKYLSSEKHYLLEQLLNSLINFHFNTSTNRKLIKLILYINLLTERGLRPKAAKILKQAKKLAYQREEFTIILQLIQMEEELLFSHGILNFTVQLRKLKEEREEITRKIQNLNELRLLKVQARELQFEDYPHVIDPDKYPHIFKSDFLDNPETVNSCKAQDAWFYIQSVKYYLLREFKASLESNRQHLQFFEANESIFTFNQKLPLLSNYLYLAAKVQDQPSFQEAITKLEALEGKKDIDSIYIGYIKYARMLELYYKSNQIEASKTLIPEVNQYLERSEQQLGSTEVDYLLILLIRAGILTGQFTQTQQWLNHWYKIENVDTSLNIIKMLSMITYFELQYLNLLRYEIDSTYKSLKKRKRLRKLERTMIRFFKKYTKSPNPAPQLSAVKDLEQDLEVISEDPIENVLFEQFDFLQWSREKREMMELEMK